MKKYLGDSFKYDKKGVWAIIFIVSTLLGGFSREAADSLNISGYWKDDIKSHMADHIERYHSDPEVWIDNSDEPGIPDVPADTSVDEFKVERYKK